jgi:hypothetical protein
LLAEGREILERTREEWRERERSQRERKRDREPGGSGVSAGNPRLAADLPPPFPACYPAKRVLGAAGAGQLVTFTAVGAEFSNWKQLMAAAREEAQL